MAHTLLHYLPLLALTLLIELGIVALLFRGTARRTALLGCLAVNLLSHPLAVLTAQNDVLPWGAIELLVVLGELGALAGLLRLPAWRAASAVLLGNVLSAGAGIAWALIQAM